jgi:hypothetical protein
VVKVREQLEVIYVFMDVPVSFRMDFGGRPVFAEIGRKYALMAGPIIIVCSFYMIDAIIPCGR